MPDPRRPRDDRLRRERRPGRGAVVDGERRQPFLLASVSRAEGRRHLVDGEPARRRAPSCARRWPCSCPIAWRSSRARRPSAAPTSTGSSRRSGRPAPSCAATTAGRSRSATRCSAGSRPGLRRTRAGRLGPELWPQRGIELIADRAEAAAELARLRRGGRGARARAGARFATAPRERGDAGELAAELAERREADLARGYTGWGPHHDELELVARRPLPAPLRVAGPAARGPAGAAVRRARGADRRRAARAADAARRRHQRARPGTAAAARRASPAAARR